MTVLHGGNTLLGSPLAAPGILEPKESCQQANALSTHTEPLPVMGWGKAKRQPIYRHEVFFPRTDMTVFKERRNLLEGEQLCRKTG